MDKTMSQTIAILGFLMLCIGLYKDDVCVYTRKWVVVYLTGFVIMCVGAGLYVYEN